MQHYNPEKRPGFFQLITGSFHSNNMYDRFSKVKIGSAIAFLALFLFLLIFIGTGYVLFRIDKGMSELAKEYDTILPEIRIKNGEVLVDAEMPYIRETKEKGESTIIIIDTTGRITSLEDYRDYRQAVLLTKNKVISKRNAYDTRTYDLSEVKDFTLNREKILEWKKALAVILFPIVLVFWYFYKLFVTALQVGIFTLIGRVISDSKAAGLDYSRLANISMLAIVPALIVSMILYMLSTWIKIPGFLNSLIFLVLYIGYLYFAINGISRIQGEPMPVSAQPAASSPDHVLTVNDQEVPAPGYNTSEGDISSGTGEDQPPAPPHAG